MRVTSLVFLLVACAGEKAPATTDSGSEPGSDTTDTTDPTDTQTTPPATHSVGGTVFVRDSVTLRLNGGDDLELTERGTFTFATALVAGSAYDVTVAADSTLGDCVVVNGAGTVADADVTDIEVTCTTTETFEYTGAEQLYTIPADVTSLTVHAYGAAGADGADGTSATGGGGVGGLGSLVVDTVAVTPGDALHIFVGGAGSADLGGFNGGGPGGVTYVFPSDGNGGGGGGASDVRLNSADAGARVVVAGGGGGGGGEGCSQFANLALPGGTGGAGGGGVGGNGADALAPNGGWSYGASGGSPGMGGAAGVGCSGYLGTDGTDDGAGGISSTNASCDGSRPAGGGGGGGLVVGGGGGGGSLGTDGCSYNDRGAGGGGAGGTSLMSPSGVETQGARAGDGQVVITIP